ncbi:TonB-dependent receptor domain-containing protein [Caulobacter segnis]
MLAAIRDYTNISKAKQDLAEGRLVADGTLFAMPGGDVRLAVGAEYHHARASTRPSPSGPRPRPSATPSRRRGTSSRCSAKSSCLWSAHGNAKPFLRALDLTGSVRYDDYSDVGGTTNPKIGFNYTPFDGVRIRGNWGTSFHAPSLADTTGAVDARVTSIPIALNVRPGDPAGSNLRPILYISGGSPTLEARNGRHLVAGRGLQAEVSARRHGQPDLLQRRLLGRDQRQRRRLEMAARPSTPMLRTPLTTSSTRPWRRPRPSRAAPGPTTSTPWRRSSRPTARMRSTTCVATTAARVKQDGLDFNLQAYRATSFGSLSASLAGTYTLNRKTSDANNGIYVDRLKNGVGRFNYVATAGGTYGKVTARATLTHSGGYPILGRSGPVGGGRLQHRRPLRRRRPGRFRSDAGNAVDAQCR